ncbi:myosin light chain kinase, putative [Entamoeba invadens IP1]|uniref:non-specific serine/threonine protein kinase n=1 Tax=Entamoeba invadens IP1 TaxID=370355 RepID=A0A0A1U861_ENTIV|nr:myosin light chain kinase, putative [Entamoeba invadens IP1]ELP91088.1 myosin light chain kinase, putative [Entamoeba invadens IP1]|eukprot:XP_004257859.1 myosin light chain kinase, putative [Entamoeba invadens IP1]
MSTVLYPVVPQMNTKDIHAVIDGHIDDDEMDSSCDTQHDKVNGSPEITSYTEIQKQFVLLQIVGRGGFSVVYKALHKASEEVVALKVIDKSLVNTTQLQTLKREIGFAKCCIHKYILKVYDIFEDGDSIYEVLKYAKGGNLYERITHQVLTEQQAQWVMYQVASAIYYLHSNGICDRDIKPENILLMDSSSLNVNLVDFGLAKKFVGDVLKTPCGTFNYAPPEILLKMSQYTHLCDIFSFGVTLFVSMCGYYPFDGDSIMENVQQMIEGDINFDESEWDRVSEECKNFIRKCLSANIENRLNIEGVLTHPWLCGHSVYTNPYFQPLLIEMKSGISALEEDKSIYIDRPTM